MVMGGKQKEEREALTFAHFTVGFASCEYEWQALKPLGERGRAVDASNRVAM
jgi:hypothetical protein